jgi:DNA polymerase III alpha subunit
LKDIKTKYIEVETIEEIDETSDVYDITVEDNHNFFANNILVHNCLGGIYSNRILRGNAHNKSRDEIQKDLLNLTDRFTDAVGLENFKLELQFNKLEKQHVVNDYLIEHHKLTGIPLISTADSHYPTNDKWQARELYKKLGWLGKKDGMTLPEFEDLKCELYPKNAQQMWNEFLESYPLYDFYKGNEQLVKESIERTHDIVWNDFEDTWIDTSAKLPTISVPNKTPFQHLAELVKNALIKEGLHKSKEYVDRAKYELSDIKYLGHAAYFITMYEIFKRAETKTLFGAGRGSGAGSLVNYLLGITQIDPIPYNLLWSRFLGRHRCLDEDTYIISEHGKKKIKDVVEGEKVLTHTGQYRKILDKAVTQHDIAIEIKFNGRKIICSPNHRWIVNREGIEVETMACHLKKGDKLVKNIHSCYD